QTMKELIYKKTDQGDLRIRIYEPDAAKGDRPAILFFFGGAWKKGNLDQFKTHSEHLARHGMVAACAEYRVSERHGTSPIECVEDGRSAYRWLKSHATEFGIDKKRIVSAGGSAGGHVALCVSLADEVNAEGDDLSVACDPSLLVLFNPVCDVVSRADRLKSEDLAGSISPLHLLESHIQPSILFYGSEDKMIEEGRAFVERSGEIGANTTTTSGTSSRISTKEKSASFSPRRSTMRSNIKRDADPGGPANTFEPAIISGLSSLSGLPL
ncbi:MAG: alpha/beta hydrolase, partial [Proteobacteria bacterium]|nr:alpha/beta hydrolase [Pseudomonadota bacterium]